MINQGSVDSEYEGDDDGSDVCRDMDLQELANSVINTITPHLNGQSDWGS